MQNVKLNLDVAVHVYTQVPLSSVLFDLGGTHHAQITNIGRPYGAKRDFLAEFCGDRNPSLCTISGEQRNLFCSVP